MRSIIISLIFMMFFGLSKADEMPNLFLSGHAPTVEELSLGQKWLCDDAERQFIFESMPMGAFINTLEPGSEPMQLQSHHMIWDLGADGAVILYFRVTPTGDLILEETMKAAQWNQQYPNAISDSSRKVVRYTHCPTAWRSSLSTRVDAGIAAMGLSGMTQVISQWEIDTQWSGAISFETALEQSLQSVLSDCSDAESPLALILEPVQCEAATATELLAAQKALQLELKQPRTRLSLLGREGEAPHGENASHYWIFSMVVPSLGDHVLYVMVDKMGAKPVYNYGIN